MKIIRELTICLLLIGITLTMGCKTAKNGSTTNLPSPIANIINANQSKLKSIEQLIIVYNNSSEKNETTLIALEQNNSVWSVKFQPIKAYIGREGFATLNEKYEGDGKSPTGLFGLGRLFTYESEVDTKMPFVQVTAEDKWIDDPESDDYNKYVRGKTDAKSYERLLLGDYWYKYCMVIEYNTNPVVKGKGSAIFFHLGDEPSSGCVVIDEKDMTEILRWLAPQKNPYILMGPENALLKGL